MDDLQDFAPELQPFTPSPTVGNDYYVQKIKRAIKRGDTKNVALTGEYGTGKSSILEGLKKTSLWKLRHKTKFISFKTLDPKSKQNKSPENKHGYNPSDKYGIQTEIFKQLYFGESPNKLPRSRYKRVGRQPGTWILPIISIVVAFIIASFFQIQNIVPFPVPRDAQIFPIFDTLSLSEMEFLVFMLNVAIYALLLCIFLWHIFAYIYDHPLKSIQLPNLSVDLSDERPEFEQMLDEIIYFFKRTRYKVVVLEDIDRFDDVKIYEDLTLLNFTINNARHIHHKVTFVYPLRESLIKDATSRAKLFDIAIPVIPFMSPNNAEQYVEKCFSEAGFQFDEIKNMAYILGEAVNDMRTLKMIANTSMVLKDVLDKSTSRNNLGDKWQFPRVEEIAAMATIRELYPEEYRDLQSGKGKLDELFREYSGKHLRKVEEARIALENKRNLSQFLQSKKGLVWEAIIDLKSGETVQCANITIDRKPNRLITLDDLPVQEIIEALGRGENIAVEVDYIMNGYHQQKTSKISKETLFEKSKEIEDLFDFLAKTEEEYRTRLVEAEKEDVFHDFTPDSVPELGEFPAMQAMLREGLISENYRMYLTSFDGYEDSFELLKFRLVYVRHRESNFSFKLYDYDIKKLLNYENGRSLSSPAFYNVSIATYLMKNHRKYADEIKQLLSPRDSEDKKQLFKFYGYWVSKEAAKIAETYTGEQDLLKMGANPLRFTLKDDLLPVMKFGKFLAEQYLSEMLDFTASLKILKFALSTLPARDILLALALCSVSDSSEIIFEDVDVLSRVENIFEATTACQSISTLNLVKIFEANNYKISDLSAFLWRGNVVVDYILQHHLFNISKENISALNERMLLGRALEDYAFSDDDARFILNELAKVKRGKNAPELIKGLRKVHGVFNKVADHVIESEMDIPATAIEALCNNGQRAVNKDKIARILLKSSCSSRDFARIARKMGAPYTAAVKPNSPMPDNELVQEMKARYIELKRDESK